MDVNFSFFVTGDFLCLPFFGCLSWRLGRRPHLYLPVQARAFLRHQPWQRPIKCSGGATEPDAISEASTRETESTTTESHTEGVDVACMDVRCFEEESSDTIIYCFCAGAPIVGVPKVEFVLFYVSMIFWISMAQTPFSPRVPLVTMSKCVSDHVRPVGGHSSRRKRFCTVDRCEKLIGRASVFSAQIQSLNLVVTFVFAQL